MEESKQRSIGSSAPGMKGCPLPFFYEARADARDPAAADGCGRVRAVLVWRLSLGYDDPIRRIQGHGVSASATGGRLELPLGAPIAQTWTPHTFTNACSPPLSASDLADCIPAGLCRLAFAARIRNRSLWCSRRRRPVDRCVHRHSLGGPHSLLAASKICRPDGMGWLHRDGLFLDRCSWRPCCGICSCWALTLHCPPATRPPSTHRRRDGRWRSRCW